MSKSIIGYYSLPLTQVERDEVTDILYPIVARRNTAALVSYIAGFIKEIIQDNEFVSLSHQQAAAVMTDRLQRRIKEQILPVGGLTTEHLDSIGIDIDTETGATYIEMSDEMAAFYKLEKFVTPPADDLVINQHILDVCNNWLSENPDSRIFDKSRLALQVDATNFEILKKLDSHSYQSETRAPIYDFSKEILSFLNAVQKD